MKRLPIYVTCTFLLGGFVAQPTFARAENQNYPSKTVHLIVPFSAGGATDVLARLVADGLTSQWKQSVVVENRPGATGSIAAEFVKRATPDGYTLLVGTASVNSVAPSVRHNLHYNTLRDFKAITNIATFPNMLVINPSVPARSVTEFIQVLKNNPGKYNFASSGIGSSIHLTGELFKQATGTDMVHIPYKGSAPARTALLAGNVQVMFDNISSAMPLVQQGRLIALAVTSRERDPYYPNIPAVAETVPGFDATSWIGLMAPVGTPKEIVNKIASAVAVVIRQPSLTEKMKNLGLTAAANGPASFEKFLKADIEKWGKVVKTSGISLN